MPKTSAARQRLTGIALMCCAVACFSGIDGSAKYLNQFLHPVLGAWVRYTGSVFFVMLFINPLVRPGLMRSTRPLLQTVRSLLLLASTVLSFYALKSLQLTQATSIQFAMPLLVALLAGPILGERIGLYRAVAIAFGFLGVLIITRPGPDMPPAMLLSVLSTICYAFYNIMTRHLARYDSSATTLVYSGLAGMLLISPAIPFIWTTPPTLSVWFAMVAAGFFGAIGHGLLILAYARAPASMLSPFSYTQVIWATLAGFVIFGDLPDRWTVFGCCVVIVSGLFLIVHEQRRKPVADAAPDRE